MSLYATVAEYNTAYEGRENVPAVTEADLREASLRVDSILYGARYDAADTGVQEALRLATIRQAYAVAQGSKGLAGGITPEMLESASIGGASYRFREGVTAFPEQLVAGVSLAAVEVLRGAGLLDFQPYVHG